MIFGNKNGKTRTELKRIIFIYKIIVIILLSYIAGLHMGLI